MPTQNQITVNPYENGSGYELYLSSRFAKRKDAVYENNCTWRAQYRVREEGTSFQIRIKSLTLPVSWYLVEVGRNDTFLMSFAGAAATALTIPVGNYDAYTLAAALTAAATAAGKVLSVTFSTTTNKYTFTTTTLEMIAVVRDGNTMLREFGFYGLATDVSGTTSLSSTTPIDLTGNNSIYVKTNFDTPNYDSSTEGTGGTLGRVSCNVQYGGVLDPDPASFDAVLVNDTYVGDVTIELLNESAQPLRLDAAWDMTLAIALVPDPTYKAFGRQRIKQRANKRVRAAQQQAGVDVNPETGEEYDEDNAANIAAIASGDVDMSNLEGEEEPPPATEDELRAQETLTEKLGEKAAEYPDPLTAIQRNTWGPDVHAPATRGMLGTADEIRAMASQVDHLELEPAQQIISPLQTIGPVTVFTSNAGPGPQE